MLKSLVCFLLFLMTIFSWSQERTLPPDIRQHNLTQFNANLFNASYATDWNNPNSFSIWTRWQWQTVDGDPTSIFANYTHQLNQRSALGIGFLQHNTGTFVDIGANINYAYTFLFDDNIKLTVGANLFGFQQKLADDRFVPDPDIDLPQLENTNEFIILFSPGVILQVNQFNLGLAVENALDFNFSESGGSEDLRILTGTLSNDFPVTIFSGEGNSFIRPIVYVRAIPNEDTQFGINGLFSTSKFWVQGGYNSFYGVSGGLGATFAKQFSIGGLLEFGTDTSLSDEDPTFELIASYHFGKTDSRKKVIGFDVEKDDALALERIKAEDEKQRRKELEEKTAIEQERLKKEQTADTKKEQELLTKQQFEKDSIAKVQLAVLKLQEEQKRRDSIAELQEAQNVQVRPNEKYEEVANAEGLEPGFYLIANVFGTKKYYENFMLTLRKKGLDPKSFYRSQNKYNYVYLERYNSMNEARNARDSKFFGKYPDKIWIFRVRGK
ncbi:PorP/SprF family type IX secretion system membrane protein [Allomuricauda sp. R78024]|uniref:PorP/SprF family type IX secretion system membrane protein n=1 Tax=Allomuricauda sp. R78024 TaxID=3093867 RepID=UPI0037C6DAFE